MGRTQAAWCATAGAVAVVIGSFLPWLASGDRRRSSYELAGLARRLDFATGPVARTGVVVWPLVPVLVAAAVLAVWAGWRRAARGLALVAGAYVAAICVVAWRAPLPAQAGIAVTFAGSVGLLVVGALHREGAVT